MIDTSAASRPSRQSFDERLVRKGILPLSSVAIYYHKVHKQQEQQKDARGFWGRHLGLAQALRWTFEKMIWVALPLVWPGVFFSWKVAGVGFAMVLIWASYCRLVRRSPNFNVASAHWKAKKVDPITLGEREVDPTALRLMMATRTLSGVVVGIEKLADYRIAYARPSFQPWARKRYLGRWTVPVSPPVVSEIWGEE